MKRLITVLLMLLFVIPTMAQEDDPEVFTSEDKLLTFEYPQNWFVEERLYPYINTIVLVNQEEMLPTVSSPLLLPEQAEIMIQVLALSDYIFAGISEDTSIEDLKAIFLQVFGSVSEEQVSFAKYEHPEYEALSGDMYFEEQGYSGYGIWMLPGNGILIQVGVIAPDNKALEYSADAEIIANTVTFTGSEKDVSRLQGEPPDDEAFRAFMEVMSETRANDERNQAILEVLQDND